MGRIPDLKYQVVCISESNRLLNCSKWNVPRIGEGLSLIFKLERKGRTSDLKSQFSIREGDNLLDCCEDRPDIAIARNDRSVVTLARLFCFHATARR